jgi:nitrate reductase gamma subunit
MSGSIVLALSYGLLAVFVVAAVLRSVRLWRLPIHLRWELAPIPKEKTRGRYGGSYLEEFEWWTKPREESMTAELAYMLKEIVFLKALWEHNRRLWWFSFPFHVGLYVLVAVGGLLVLAGAAGAMGLQGPGWGLMRQGLPILIGVACVLGTVGALGLVVSRLFDARLRNGTTPVAMFNLILVLALFVTGGVALFSVDGYAGQASAFAAALFRAQPPPALSTPLGVHVAVALVFLAYLPFSQMMHFVAKYFTYHQVRWDDRPLEPGGAIEREVTELLQQPVTWAAPHVGADGKKNWVDIATEEVPK